jgi:hypothetical protein
MVQRVYLDLPTEGGPVLRIRGSEGDWRVRLWPARFHQALANWYQGDREAAKLIAEEISAPPPDLPPAQRVSTAAQHLQRAGPGQRQ